jgi:hypothetical protein
MSWCKIEEVQLEQALRRGLWKCGTEAKFAAKVITQFPWHKRHRAELLAVRTQIRGRPVAAELRACFTVPRMYSRPSISPRGRNHLPPRDGGLRLRVPLTVTGLIPTTSKSFSAPTSTIRAPAFFPNDHSCPHRSGGRTTNWRTNSSGGVAATHGQ